MRKLIICFISVISLTTATNAQSTTFTTKEFSPLQALTGVWKMTTQRGVLYEEWKRVSANHLAGRSYKINNGDTAVQEQVQLTLQGSDIYYTPTVHDQNNQQPVPFKLISCTGNRYVFENKEHDFPQRVIYELPSATELHARIEGSINGKERGSDFNYTWVR